MKKLLIIVFFLPLIGLGQITVTEVTTAQKKENNARLSYSFKSGLGIEIFHNVLAFDSQYPDKYFFSYYFIPNVTYNIPINNKLGIYNNISLPIILIFRKRFEWQESLSYNGVDTTLNYSVETPSTLITKLDYNIGFQAEIMQGLQSRLGITIPIIGYPIEFEEFQRMNDIRDIYYRGEPWGGGFHLEFDYPLTDNLCSSLSISHELYQSLFIQPQNPFGNTWLTEILIGVNYKL